MGLKLSGSTGVSMVQDGIISESKLATGAVTDTKLTLTPNSQEIKDALNATGSAPIYACRAWVNFNGTGTVAIRASGNVSSITDVGNGQYGINFASAMPDANYVVAVSAVVTTSFLFSSQLSGLSSSYVDIILANSAQTLTDSATVNVAIFR